MSLHPSSPFNEIFSRDIHPGNYKRVRITGKIRNADQQRFIDIKGEADDYIDDVCLLPTEYAFVRDFIENNMGANLVETHREGQRTVTVYMRNDVCEIHRAGPRQGGRIIFNEEQMNDLIQTSEDEQNFITEA